MCIAGKKAAKKSKPKIYIAYTAIRNAVFNFHTIEKSAHIVYYSV